MNTSSTRYQHVKATIALVILALTLVFLFSPLGGGINVAQADEGHGATIHRNNASCAVEAEITGLGIALYTSPPVHEFYGVETPSGIKHVRCYFEIPEGFEPDQPIIETGFQCAAFGLVSTHSFFIARPNGTAMLFCKITGQQRSINPRSYSSPRWQDATYPISDAFLNNPAAQFDTDSTPSVNQSDSHPSDHAPVNVPAEPPDHAAADTPPGPPAHASSDSTPGPPGHASSDAAHGPPDHAPAGSSNGPPDHASSGSAHGPPDHAAADPPDSSSDE